MSYACRQINVRIFFKLQPIEAKESPLDLRNQKYFTVARLEWNMGESWRSEAKEVSTSEGQIAKGLMSLGNSFGQNQ